MRLLYAIVPVFLTLLSANPAFAEKAWPVSDHSDGETFFNPGIGAIDKSFAVATVLADSIWSERASAASRHWIGGSRAKRFG